MQCPVPFFPTHFLRSIESYSVAPKVGNVSNVDIEIALLCFSCDKVGILHELEEELIEICLDVDALKLWIVVLID